MKTTVEHDLQHTDELPEQEQDLSSGPAVIQLDEIRRIINLNVCRLTSDVSLPQSKVKEIIKFCDSTIQHVSEYLEGQVLQFLELHSILLPDNELIRLRNTFHLNDMFSQIDSFTKQKKFLDKMTVQSPVPRDILLNRRQDVRHVNSLPKKVLVNETASYISIVDTLKLLFRDPNARHLLEEPESVDTPCVTEFSSFKTGELFKTNEYFKENPNCIRLSIYQDDVELGNTLSSRAGINKICNFSFKIQNLPDKWNSSPRTVFPLLFCSSIDAKKHGYNKILQPLINDLKTLEEGVTVFYGNEPFVIKAVVTMFCGDTLAVHDVFGLLGPSAKYFCRICQISRPEFHDHPSGEYPLRNRQWYENQLKAVQSGQISSKDCGLKPSGCIFNELQHFHTSGNYNLDGMHDLAEGVVPLVIQLVLSSYSKQNDLSINATYINNRINTFAYGYTDRHNKPSANFTEEMLSHPNSHRIRQTSAQVLLLLRSFPFLFGHKIPTDCQLMKMIGHLINIVRIIMSTVVSEHLILQLQDHLSFFEQTYYTTFDRHINKLHHLKHYALCIMKSGAMKQYNCLQFEQTNKVGKDQAATCKNFKNICHSLAKRQCVRMVINILDNPLCDKLTFSTGRLLNREECLSEAHLDPSVKLVFVPKTAHLNGVE